jgi:hypothetical protein
MVREALLRGTFLRTRLDTLVARARKTGHFELTVEAMGFPHAFSTGTPRQIDAMLNDFELKVAAAERAKGIDETIHD